MGYLSTLVINLIKKFSNAEHVSSNSLEMSKRQTSLTVSLGRHPDIAWGMGGGRIDFRGNGVEPIESLLPAAYCLEAKINFFLFVVNHKASLKKGET